MNLLKTAIREIVGLFIDDEFLAVATLVVVGVTAMVVKGTTAGVMAEVTLPGGCLLVLVAGVWRTARSGR
jgi:hypothetical protein